MSRISRALFLLFGPLMVVVAQGQTFSKCDILHIGTTNVVDVQAIINEALGVTAPNDDLNGDGSVNVVDVQIVINAALGLGCSADTTTGPAPAITSFTPASAPAGTLVTVTGTNLQPATGAAQITLAQQGGGTIAGPVTSAAPTTLMFVIPAGAATGNVQVTANGSTATSTTPLTIVPPSTFGVTALPAIANLIQGQSVSYTVGLTSTTGFTQLATLGISGLPTGATATFFPPQITLGQTSVLTVSAPLSQPVAMPTLTVSAAATVSGIPVTSSTTVTLNVIAVTTSFTGRTVVDNGTQTSLAGVTVSTVGQNGSGVATGCTGHSTTSDASGNFALTGLPAACLGTQLISFNGNTVTSPAGVYAGLQLVFTLVSNTVVVSPVLVNLPQVNTAETFNVMQNDPVDQSYTFTTIPGLSVTVYAGTTFTLSDGVTKPNPFPLAAIQVPVDRLPDLMPVTSAGVATFIVAFQPAETNASQAVAVYFPNTSNTAPGTDVPLMTLDPTQGRMVPYGTGTVSADGTTIIPDINPSVSPKRYGIVHFDWHGPLGGTPNENDPPPDPNSPSGGEPVDFASGLDIITSTDIGFHGNRGSIALTRTYRTGAVQGNIPGPFGWGGFHNYEYRLDTLTPQSSAVINLILPTGTRVPFNLQANGTLINTTTPMFAGWVMTTTAAGGTTLTQKNGTYFQFVPGIPPTGSVMVAIGDPNGNVTNIVRAPGVPYQISEIDDPAGRKLTFQYSGYTISSITDPIGRTVSYTYNSAGYLATYTNVLGGVTSYQYNSQGNVTQITDPHGAITKNTYDSNGRVISQVLPSGGTMTFAYTLVNSLVPTSPVTKTVVTDPLGNVTTYRFNTNGFVVGVTDATGQVRTFNRQLGTNLLLSLTGSGSCPSCGNTQGGDFTYTYDAFGNLLSQTDALGHTWTLTYDPIFSNITAVTDPLGNTTARFYDARGNLLKITDARGNNEQITWSGTGLPTSIQDAGGNVTSLTYDSLGNLVSATNPASQKWQYSFDGVSRLAAQKDPLGRISTLAYNAANQITARVDGNGHTSQSAFDVAGNLMSVTDPNGGKTTFGYDAVGRLNLRTDPLTRVIGYQYDTNDDMVSFTNRRGQQAQYAFDGLSRIVTQTYADATVHRTYDSRGRLAQIVDSQSGTFNMTYDLAGRLLTMIGPNGGITYTRDADGRVASRQVTGLGAVAYTYDPNGNLTNAALGSATVARTYDPRNLLLTNTRSNGVAGSYAFDAVGRITSISETSGNSTVFSRAFTYDAVGEIVANTLNQGLALSTAAATGTVDASNEATAFGATTYTSDADGHRLTSTSGGVTTNYTWDARGRLQSIASAGTTTSFVYDPSGQMITSSVTSGGTTTTQQYVLDDISNIASVGQGQSAISVLDGRRRDDIMATVQGGASIFPLPDQIGSEGAFTNNAGAVVGSEFYEPYGASTASGTAGLVQFAGRPAFGSGLYYDRARFYDSAAGKFISEDPLQFSDPSTFNLYRYAYNDPISFRDPSGKWGFGLQTGGNADAGIVGAGGTLQLQTGTGVFGGGPGGVNAGTYDSGTAQVGGPGYGAGAPSPAGNSWGGGSVVGGASIGGELGGFFTNAHCAGDLSDNFDTYFLNLPIGGASFGTGTTSDGRTIWIFTIGAGPSLGASGGGATTNTFATHTWGQ